jgi:hypothetical protein
MAKFSPGALLLRPETQCLREKIEVSQGEVSVVLCGIFTPYVAAVTKRNLNTRTYN